MGSQILFKIWLKWAFKFVGLDSLKKIISAELEGGNFHVEVVFKLMF